MENLIIQTNQEVINRINKYNKDQPTAEDFQALYQAIAGYSNRIENIKGTTDLIAFYKGLNLKHEFFQEKLVTEIIKQNHSIIKSSGLLSILINNLGIEDDEKKIDLAIAIIKLRPSIAYDLITSENLSTFIDDLKITDDKQKEKLDIAMNSYYKNITQYNYYYKLKMSRKENKESERQKIQDNTNKHDNINKIHISTFNHNIINSEVDVADEVAEENSTVAMQITGYNQRNKTNTYYESFHTKVIEISKKAAVQIKKSDGNNDIPDNKTQPLTCYQALRLKLRQFLSC